MTHRVELADEVKLPRIHWSWPTVADDHPDAPALALLATVLAGGETSRLYKSLVRDLRLATDVSADDDAKEIAGYFTLQATAAEGKSTDDIEKVFAKEIGRLKAEPPSPAELARVVARIETGLYTGLTKPIGRAIAISTGFAQHDDPEHYRKEFARYFQVTPADVQRVAAQYLTDAKVKLLVRPVKPGETKTELAPVGPEPAAGQARRGPHASARPGPRLVEAARAGEAGRLPASRLPAADALQRDRPLDRAVEDPAAGQALAPGAGGHRRRSRGEVGPGAT